MKFVLGRLNSPISVLTATAISGAAGYFVLWYVPFFAGFNVASPFVLFWSFLFFLVGVASGVQQETSRAVISRESSWINPKGFNLRIGFLFLSISGLFILTVLGAQQFVFDSTESQNFLAPLLFGVVGYISLAVLTGIQYGTLNFGFVAIGLLIESLSRLILIVISLSTSRIEDLYWAVSSPFWFSSLALFIVFILRNNSRIYIDVTFIQLFINSLKTIFASLSIAIMMSGFPLIIFYFSQGISQDQTSFLVVISSFFRAPLMIAALALQSLLIVYFRKIAPNANIKMIRIVVWIGAVGFILCCFTGFWGGQLTKLIFPNSGDIYFDSYVYISLVLSSAILAAITVTGAAALARAKHSQYLAGWLIAATLTVFSAIIPMNFALHMATTLLLGPVCGLVYLLITQLRKLESDI